MATMEVVQADLTRMPARFVIHTVGPVWRGGAAGEAESLRRCYVSCLEAAEHSMYRELLRPVASA